MPRWIGGVPGWARPVPRRLRDAAPWLVPLLAGMVGALVAVGLLAHQEARVGPATVRLAARPALSGSSRLAVPPFGSVSADTHVGPLALSARLDDVDVQALGRLLEAEPSDSGLRGLEVALLPLEGQARAAARRFVLRIGLLGVLGGAAAVLVLPRRTRRRLAWCGLGGLLATGALLAPTLASYDVGAFSAPRYQGALEYAPVLVGDARTAVERLRTLRQEMARIGENLDRAYAALGQPTPDLGGGTVRVLHISDVHLNPAGFDLAGRLAEQFDVAAVVDSGDMGTWGLPFERAVPRQIGAFKVPYLFVKGNHDNAAMVQAIAANRNARVLDGSVAEVAGIRFYGLADPTFSPGRGYRREDFVRQKVARSAGLAAELDNLAPPADVLVVHDPALATYAAGRVATVLDGHLHRSGTELRNGTRFLDTGSVGAAGPDGLRAPAPVPHEAEVIYFDPATRRPLAVDHISVRSLESAFSVDRELLREGQTAFARDPVPVPPPTTGPAPASPGQAGSTRPG